MSIHVHVTAPATIKPRAPHSIRRILVSIATRLLGDLSHLTG